MAIPPSRPALLDETYALSVADVARVLGIGKTTIYSLLKEGDLTSFKIGRRTLIHASSVRELVDDASEKSDG